MRITDRLRFWLARGLVKAASSPLIPAWAQATFTEPIFTALANEGYKGNGAVFACASALAFAFPEPMLRVWREEPGGNVLFPRHPLEQMLRHPNPVMGYAELLQLTMIYQAIGGDAFWYKRRARSGQVVQLWPLSRATLTPIYSSTELLSHYELTVQDGPPERIERTEIVHFKWLPDPLAPWKGQPPLAAVAREVDTDNEATRYLFALLKNDAIPRVVVTAAPGTPPLDTEQRMQFDIMWSEYYGGTRRGKPAILAPETKIQTLSMNLQELAFEALRRVPEARICAAFRTPPVVAGLNVGLEQSTYANFEEAVRSFTQRTMVPLWNAAASEITDGLLTPDFGGGMGLVAAFDLAAVVALQEAVTEKRAWVDSAVSGGYLMVNEGRAALGLAPVPGGDVFLRGMATVEVGANGERYGEPAASAEPAANEPAEDAPAGPEDAKGLLAVVRRPAWATKGRAQRRKTQEMVIASLRADRRTVGGRLESAVGSWFDGLAERVAHRALTLKGVGTVTCDGAGVAGEVKAALPEAEELLPFSEFEGLGTLLKRYYIELLTLSWETWNIALGAELAFDVTDPAVVQALAASGQRIRQIRETTLAAVRKTLAWGAEQGWSVDDLVRGDADAGVPGLRELVAQTYKGRARAIARTELGTAQNRAAAARFREAGLERVYVMDNGADDDDEPCKIVAGRVLPLSWAEENELEHPNCTRATAPEFDADVDEDALRAWEAARA